MNPVVEQDSSQEWKYDKREVLSPKEFLNEIYAKMKAKRILSVGEFHDENQDASYNWILKHQGAILHAYDWYRQSLILDPSRAPALDRLLPRDSLLLDELAKQNPPFEQLAKMHVGRVFALAVLPLARSAGYTDLILEGLDEDNPQDSIENSKDRAGDLLRLTLAMSLGMRIHGEAVVAPAWKVADSLFSKIEEVSDRYRDARIIVYNGATHNMTEPVGGQMMVHEEGFAPYAANRLSYASRARQEWGSQYGAIDLLNGQKPLPDSHFKAMQENAQDTGITRYSHGFDQQTYIIK